MVFYLSIHYLLLSVTVMFAIVTTGHHPGLGRCWGTTSRSPWILHRRTSVATITILSTAKQLPPVPTRAMLVERLRGGGTNGDGQGLDADDEEGRQGHLRDEEPLDEPNLEPVDGKNTGLDRLDHHDSNIDPNTAVEADDAVEEVFLAPTAEVDGDSEGQRGLDDNGTTLASPEDIMENSAVEKDASAVVDTSELADEEAESSTESAEANSVGGPTSELEKVELESTPVPLVPRPPSEPPTEVVTKDMEKILIRELNYRRREVRAMKPHIAAVLIHNKLRRPIEGLPSHWFNGNVIPSGAKPLFKLIPRVIISVAVGVIVISTGRYVGLGSLLTVASSPSPTARTSVDDEPASVEAESEGNVTLLEEVQNVDEITVSPASDDANTTGGDRAHSVKPGQRPSDELDVTWLDKAITACERRIKAFFRMEI